MQRYGPVGILRGRRATFPKFFADDFNFPGFLRRTQDGKGTDLSAFWGPEGNFSEILW